MHRLFPLALVVFVMSCGNSSRPAPIAADTGPVAVATLPAAGEPAAVSQVTVPVPAGSAQVRFELRGLDRPAVDLTAELESEATGDIGRWPVDEAPDAAGAATFSITVPGYAVPPGAHRLTLWAGDAEIVQRYRLRVEVP